MTKKWIAAALAAVLALGAGCRQTPAAPEAPAAESKASQADADAQETELELYNAYVDTCNMMRDEMTDSLNTYYDNVIYQEEFQYSQSEYFCNAIPEAAISAADTAFRLATAKPEKDDLDKAYLDLYPQLKERVATVNAIAEYTGQKGYLDDGYAKGKELHGKLWAATQTYDALEEAFLEKMDAAADAHKQENLKRLKEEGAVALYTMTVTLDAAQELLSGIYQQDVYEQNVTTLDIEALQPAYDAYEKALAECAAALADEEQVLSEGLNTEYTGRFLDDAQAARAAMDALWQRVKEQKPLDENELRSPEPADGSIGRIEALAGDMVDDYNSAIS